MAQRLVRKICESCKESYSPTREELSAMELKPEEAKTAKLFRGHGCKECLHTGYKGRIGIFELLMNTDEIREMIVKKIPSTEIREVARRAGMKLLREDGIIKALEGITTLAEVVRITHGYEE